MSREEAIESLRGILTEAVEFENSVCYVTEEDREPLEMAIKALEHPERNVVAIVPCGDAISRQAVLDKKELIELEDGQSFYCISPEDVETLPSVNPQYTEVEGQKSEDAISRQAAIEIARSNIHYGLDKEYEYARELLQKTMAEINSLPPVNLRSLNPEADREASKAYCAECDHVEMCSWYPHDGCEWLKTDRYNAGYNAAKREIVLSGEYERAYERGKADAQTKTGHWIHFAASDDCSECGWSTGKYNSPSKYCPNCGIKMIDVHDTNVGNRFRRER